MEAFKEKLKKQFGNEYFTVGLLPFLRFKATEEELNKFLLVGSEHGDKPYGTKAMLKVANKLKKNPLKNTTIDMLLVLDTEGFPKKRTAIEEVGLGNYKYMESAYEMENKPHQIKNFFTAINETKYSLALLLSAVSKEESPLINGFFAVPQLKIDGNKLSFLYPQLTDLMGVVVNSLKEKELPVLNKKACDSYLGAGNILYREGAVLQGVYNKDKKLIEEFKTTNGFLRSCAARNIPALALYALSSTSEKEFGPTKTLQSALKSVIRVYEKWK